MGNGTEGTDEAPLPKRSGAVDEAELRRRFMNRPARDMATTQAKAAIAEGFFNMARVVVELTPPGRSQAEALTHLESAQLWAAHAIDRFETHKA